VVRTGCFPTPLYTGQPHPFARMGERWDSNPQQRDPQSRALPFELRSPRSRLAGLEPATHNLEGCCSIHLSYRRKFGMVRLELTTSWSQTMRANQLRYIPGMRALRKCIINEMQSKAKSPAPRSWKFHLSVLHTGVYTCSRE
jgi:hypothetical protein